MKMKLKNSEALERLYSLKPLLSHRDKVGYRTPSTFRTQR